MTEQEVKQISEEAARYEVQRRVIQSQTKNRVSNLLERIESLSKEIGVLQTELARMQGQEIYGGQLEVMSQAKIAQERDCLGRQNQV